MNAADMNGELISAIVGVVMTLAIFSYLLSDNVLYRWALALLVGSGTGFALGVVLRYLLREWIIVGLQQQDWVGQVIYGLPLLLGILLLFKSIPRLSAVGNITMGFLIGVGSAVALSGALLGTLVPQVQALRVETMRPFFLLLNGLIVLVGTVSVLLTFSSIQAQEDGGGNSRLWMVWVRRIGRGFIAVAIAVAFSEALTTALTLMVDRLWVLADFVSHIVTLSGD